jgi:hypothetical protein
MLNKDYICVKGSSLSEVSLLSKMALKSPVPLYILIKRQNLDLALNYRARYLVEINKDDYLIDDNVIRRLASENDNVVCGFVIDDFRPPWDQVEELKKDYPESLVIFRFGPNYANKRLLGSSAKMNLCSFVNAYSSLVDYFVLEASMLSEVSGLYQASFGNFAIQDCPNAETPEVRGLHLDLEQYLTHAV